MAVLDGHPHTLAFLVGRARRADRQPRGRTTSASPATSQDLYAHFGIDSETIVGAALDLADGR